jgi:hypothetical protein
MRLDLDRFHFLSQWLADQRRREAGEIERATKTR